MPFKTNQELVDKVKGTDKLSDRKKDQFRAVFNKCFEDHGDSGSCYAQAWGAVKHTSAMEMVASDLLLVAKDIEFSYGRLESEMWRKKVKEAQERQGISFDLENDDSIEDPEVIKVGEYENADKEKVPYKFIVQLCQAGGDWQNPVCYYRIQLHPKGGYLSVEYLKFNTDNCMIFIPVNGNNNLTHSEKNDKLIPTEDGEGVKFIKPDEKALKDDLINFLEKLIDSSMNSSKEEWESEGKVEFKDGQVASRRMKCAVDFKLNDILRAKFDPEEKIAGRIAERIIADRIVKKM